MDNKYKPDCAEAMQRMQNWWAGKPTDRVVASVYAPKAGVTRRPKNEKLPDKWIDVETLAYNFETDLETTFFGGEAFPCFWNYHGPVPMTAYFGSEPEFFPNTVWYASRYDNWEAASTWKFDPANPWWQMALNSTRQLVERARGRYLVSGCGVCGLADVIANLWGSEATLIEAAVEPKVISDLLGRMVAVFRTMYDELYEIARPYQEGYFDWLNLWAPGRTCTLQNDLSCMVSPAMFRDIFLDEIRQEARHLDYACYHLDGPGAIQHLDALLSIEELRLIQWIPGAGASANPMDWLDLYRRIQAKGKKALIYCPPGQVRDVLSRLDRQAVYLVVWCRDEQEAQACLAELARIGV